MATKPPVSSPEIANAAKGDELTKAENLKAREITEQELYHAAVPGDLRSTSGNGLGDGLFSHNDKWLQTDWTMGKQGNTKPPMQYIKEAPVIKVHGPVVASYGSDDPNLGCPVEYIDLKGTSKENPAVCKYTGNKYYSDPHTWLHH
ncbi:hypothetical protein WJX73_007944 [Symbiochloris irregularis]|uniref:Uncharacterized protein n=1 Tax=Symbiochloris irregularis TaxID=706552 RepID=A0AAW1NZ74_9CHLO